MEDPNTTISGPSTKTDYRLKCRSKVLQNAPRGAILSTFIKFHFPLRPLFFIFLSGHVRQVLLYQKNNIFD